jgi:hypothetical protein
MFTVLFSECVWEMARPSTVDKEIIKINDGQNKVIQNSW